jgi:hypothetical protein
MLTTARIRDYVVEKRCESSVERVSTRAPDALRQLGRCCVTDGRLALIRQPVDESVDRAVAERAHLLTVELEWIGSRFVDAS